MLVKMLVVLLKIIRIWLVMEIFASFSMAAGFQVRAVSQRKICVWKELANEMKLVAASLTLLPEP
jgi:hypothetical protein